MKTIARNRTTLWRAHPETGVWSHERDCEIATADAWLAKFRTDEPTAKFCLGEKRPRPDRSSPLRVRRGRVEVRS